MSNLSEGGEGEYRRRRESQGAMGDTKAEVLADLKKALAIESERRHIEERSYQIFAKVVQIWEQEAREGNVGGMAQLKNVLEQINYRLGKVEQRTANQPSRAETYAGVAKATNALKTAAQDQRTPITKKLEETRRMREITVRVRNEGEAEGLRKTQDKEILERIQRTGTSGSKEVAAVRRLGSGDIRINVSSCEAKTCLEKDTTWIKALGTSAELARRTYGVLVHGVKVARVDTSNQEEIIKRITKDNET